MNSKVRGFDTLQTPYVHLELTGQEDVSLVFEILLQTDSITYFS